MSEKVKEQEDRCKEEQKEWDIFYAKSDETKKIETHKKWQEWFDRQIIKLSDGPDDLIETESKVIETETNIYISYDRYTYPDYKDDEGWFRV